MNIGSVFTIGGWFLVLVGAMCSLIFGKGLLFEKGGGFSLLMAVIVLGAIPIAAGLALVAAGSRRSKLEKENDERGFEDTVTALASYRRSLALNPGNTGAREAIAALSR